MAQLLTDLLSNTPGLPMPGVGRSGFGQIEPTLMVQGLSLDSRTLQSGQLFVALNGQQTDGRQFVAPAIQAGAVAVLVEAATDEMTLEMHGRVPVLALPQLRRQVSALASTFYGQPSRELAVVGFTGTNGKTSCSIFLAQMLAHLQQQAAVIGTLGASLWPPTWTETGHTTPNPIEIQRLLRSFVDAGANWLAVEVSSHALDQGRVEAIEFDVGVLTQVSRDHLDYHGTMAEYANAKGRLFMAMACQRKVLNLDDEWGRRWLQALSVEPSNTVVTYALERSDADVTCSDMRWHQGAWLGQLHTPWGSMPWQLPLAGDYNISNVLALVAALGERFELAHIVEAVAVLQAAPGRLQRVDGSTDEVEVFVDYAHTPDALSRTLQVLQQSLTEDTELYCVLGCGGDRDPGKRPQMARVAQLQSHHLVITSDNPRTERPQRIIDDMLLGIENTKAPAYIDSDRAAAIAWAIAAAKTGDRVLIAGKGHENYQDIGGHKLPFDDVEQARMALQRRREHSVC